MPLDKGKATFLVNICWDRMLSIASSPSHFLLYLSCAYLIFISSFNLLKILKWLTDWGGCSQGDLSIRHPRHILGTQQTFKNPWKCSHFFNQKKNKIVMDSSCIIFIFVKALVPQVYPTLCNPMDCSPPDSFVHGILQARILEWVAVPFSRGYSRPRDPTQVSCICCLSHQK